MVELDKTEVIIVAIVLAFIVGVPYYFVASIRGNPLLLNIPPTDISNAPELPASGFPGPEDLIPSKLLDQPQLNVVDISSSGFTGFRIRYGPGITIDDFEVIIGRAESEEIALEYINTAYLIVTEEDTQLPGYPGVVSIIKENDWFTYHGGHGSVFMWKTGVWFFGVRTSFESTVDDVTEGLLDHLGAINQP